MVHRANMCSDCGAEEEVPSVVDLGFEPSGIGLAVVSFFGSLH